MHTRTYTILSVTHIDQRLLAQEGETTKCGAVCRSQARWYCSSEGQIYLENQLKVLSSAFMTQVKNLSYTWLWNLCIGFSCAISHANDKYFSAIKTSNVGAWAPFQNKIFSSFICQFSNQGKTVMRKSLYNSPRKLKIKDFFFFLSLTFHSIIMFYF